MQKNLTHTWDVRHTAQLSGPEFPIIWQSQAHLPSKQIPLVQEGKRRRVKGLDSEPPSQAQRPTSSILRSPPVNLGPRG